MPAEKIPPQSYFGIGRKPYLEYFKPEGDDPANNLFFSPEMRADLKQDEAIMRAQEDEKNALVNRERAYWEGERQYDQLQAAHEFSDKAPGTSFDKMMEVLTPDMMTQPGVTQYMGLQQRASRPSRYSDQVLGQHMAMKITDPRERAAFQAELGNGNAADAAWQNHLGRSHNQKYEVALEKAGVSPDERAQARDQNGLYDSVRVTGLVERAQHDPRRDRVVTPPMLDKAFEMDKLDPTGKTSRAYKQEARDLGYLWAGFEKTPPPAAVVPAANVVPVAGTPATTSSVAEDEDIDLAAVITPREEKQAKIRAKAQEEMDKEISQAWTKAKAPIIDKLVKTYPNAKDLLGELAGILSNKEMPDPDSVLSAADADGRTPMIPYGYLTLKDLGLNPDDKAFSEPKNKRWGTQDVSNFELLHVAAKELGEKLGLVPTEEVKAARSARKAEKINAATQPAINIKSITPIP